MSCKDCVTISHGSKGTLFRVDAGSGPREDQKEGAEALKVQEEAQFPEGLGHHCVNLQHPECRTYDPHKGGWLQLAATEITHSLI